MRVCSLHVTFSAKCAVQGDDIACEECGDTADGANMLLCDGCDLGYHTRCLSPPLTAVPAGAWHCAACAGNNGKDGTPPSSATDFTQIIEFVGIQAKPPELC